MIGRVKTALRRWIGVDTLIEEQVIALTLEVAARLSEAKAEREGIITDLQTLAGQNAEMAAALHKIVAQLNHNTTTMARWAKESGTLAEIERRHARLASGAKILSLADGN